VSPVPYFFARPGGAPPWPGVVVVMEGNGIGPALLRTCQRLAEAGYAVLAPDLFHRFGGSAPDKGKMWFGELRDEDALADLAESVSELRRLGARTVGMTGFCMGGRLTYLAAVKGLDLAAAAPFYGAGISYALGESRCPITLFFGGSDQYIPPEEIDKVKAHHPDRVVVYPQAGHGFMRDGSEGYDEDASADAWKRLLGFFGEQL
jgi:carboxymethylenebutenolidase